ncbi:MAG TPA: HDOD domain-containing protein [Conexibacter sp.]|nr:HDOD domain-containing protein [Conexibacter sp.]
MSAEAAIPMTLPAGIAIARQAIHDRWTRVTGYALLLRPLRGGEELDEEHAATRVIVETFTAIGVQTLTGDQPAYVRVPRRFLLELHAFALPPARVVLEVADPDPSDGPLHAVLERLVEQRYRVSLTCNPRARIPATLMGLADSVKLDVTGLDEAEIHACAERFRPETEVLIAAGVDTPAQLAQCTAAGFDRFQGFFLCAPDVVAGQAPPTGRVAELRSLVGLYSQATFEELEQTIARDVGLSFRLLTYLNSAYFNLPRRVASVREALMLLGMRAVQRWGTLIALSGAVDTPHELTLTALLRARYCELVARELPASADGPSPDPDACFTVGLLSVMDALAGVPLEQAVASLPLTEEVRKALLSHEGPLGDVLAAVLAYERGEPEVAAARVAAAALPALYLSALAWADETSGMLRSTTATSAATTSGAN